MYNNFNIYIYMLSKNILSKSGSHKNERGQNKMQKM